jgi:deoxyhypusine synthase
MRQEQRTQIRGIDFEQSNSLEGLVAALCRTGFQASNLGRAIDLVNELLSRRTPICLSFTGNIVSSGLREVVAFLVKHRYVDTIVTTASSIEEDAIKAIGSFALDQFDTPGDALLKRREYRIGNIVAANALYAQFADLFRPILRHAHRRQIDGSPPITPSELTAQVGASLRDEGSFLYWATRNGVPVYCPGITDGAIGDNLVTYSDDCPGLCVDVVRDHRRIVEHINQRSGPFAALVIGGGIAKHYLLNASVFRGGFDAVVRISTAIEYDGSDSGGNAEESISWRKLRPDGEYVSVFSEATLALPVLVAATFAADFHRARAVATAKSTEI